MKIFLLILFSPLIFFSISLHAQLEKVIVEKYYISDSLDATDVQYILDVNGNVVDSVSLKTGSTTYRIYVDLKPGFKLTKIYGDANHVLKIFSSSVFFNNVNGGQNFGYQVNKNGFKTNPTLVLDSWLTLGNAATKNAGVLKAEDKDGCLSSIKNNSGGSSGISGGLLHNANPLSGIPLDHADGLAVGTSIGPFSSGITDSTIFGSLKPGSQFISNNAFIGIGSGAGAVGVLPDSNQVLVAQLTTKGKISFQLNIEVLDTTDVDGKRINFVAGGSVYSDPKHKNDTLLSPYLIYPLACGCQDSKYLEYSTGFSCGVDSACKTLIVFGCMDPNSCNYNPNANFNLPDLCCYPGHCKDRDIAIVCPGLGPGRYIEPVIDLYPNPAHDHMTFKISDGQTQGGKYVICDSFGRIIVEKNIGVSSGSLSEQVDISNLNSGVYFFRLFLGDTCENKIFVKK